MSLALSLLLVVWAIRDPLAIELARFPVPALVSEARTFNREFLVYLEHARWNRPRDWWAYESASRQAEAASEIWALLESAQNEASCREFRLNRLEALKQALGPVRWTTGQLPPIVPLWFYGLEE